MDILLKTLGIVLAGVAVILFYVATPVLGAIFGHASPLSFMIYVGVGLSFLWLAVIMLLSTIRTGHIE